LDRKTFLANYDKIKGRVLVVDNIDERSFAENHCSVLPPETVALSLGLVCTDSMDTDIARRTQALYTLTTGAEVMPDDIDAIVNKRNDEVHQNLHRLTIQAVPISDSIGETIKMLEHFLKHA